MRNKNKIVDIDVTIKHQTAAAILVDDAHGNGVWLAKSLVEIHDDGTISLPEWLAVEKELI